MRLPIDVEPGIADHDHRWLPTGRDGAWPDRHVDLPKWPWRLGKLSVINSEIARQIVIARSDRSVRPARSLPTCPGAIAKSP